MSTRVLDPKELDEMSMNLPELVYKQEILAEFIEAVGWSP